LSEKGQADLKQLKDFRGRHVVVADLLDRIITCDVDFDSREQVFVHMEKVYINNRVLENGCSFVNRETGVGCKYTVSDFKSFMVHTYRAHINNNN
jgi:hypothetical protein